MRGVWEGVFSTRGGSQLREYLLHQHSADKLMHQDMADYAWWWCGSGWHGLCYGKRSVATVVGSGMDYAMTICGTVCA